MIILFFAKRYGHRAVVLDTVAGVLDKLNHLHSLRKMQPDYRGWIKTLSEEAENNHLHFIIFGKTAQPNGF